ncbi:MAG: DUF433 domain-containing protein [Bryobacteraceae bacterium]|nr:DUF433 domain-containing protein [Bryobacteraceae bacterium]
MANLYWSQCPVLESVPDKVSGAWVFRGTRVPVSAVLRSLPAPLDQVLEDYPSVTREQIEVVLEFLARSADPIFTGESAASLIIHAHSPR